MSEGSISSHPNRRRGAKEVKRTNRVALFLNTEQCAALGLYVAHFGYFESEINFTIKAMSKSVYGSAKISSRFNERMQHWKTVLPQYIKKKQAIKAYKGIIATAIVAHKTRSRLLHSRIVGDPKAERQLIRFENIRRRSRRPKFLAPRELRTMALLLANATTKLANLNRRHLAAQSKMLPNAPTSISSWTTSTR